jgi:prepilin-type N-terminal cleavage/methylation domain-containing protein/prepilin-type processing-associated H-X9-DG protein
MSTIRNQRTASSADRQEAIRQENQRLSTVGRSFEPGQASSGGGQPAVEPGAAAKPDGEARAGAAAFTLLELLVAISVLAIVASLLLPALSRAKDRGRAVFCLNNLRQWGLATQLYALDHDDFLPPEGTPNPGENTTNSGWYIQLPRQLGLPRYHDLPWRTNAAIAPGWSVWICPANPRRSNGRNLFHYCLNAHLNGTGDDNRPVRLGSLSGHSQLVWLFDSKNLPAVGYWGYTHTNLHQGGAQFLFLDGHARRHPRAAYWDEERNRGRTDNPALQWVPGGSS